jgi:hypothetical protein
MSPWGIAVMSRAAIGGLHEVLLQASTTAIEKSSLHWSVSTRRGGHCCACVRNCSIHPVPVLCWRRTVAKVVFVSSFMARVPRNLEWADQARGTAKASIAFPQWLRLLFFPCRQEGAFLAEDKKAV